MAKNGLGSAFQVLRAVMGCHLLWLDAHPSLPYRLIVNITNNCNSCCLTCGIWRDPQAQERLGEELTPAELGRILAGVPDLVWLTLGGGEPFLRRELPEMAAEAAGNCPSLTTMDLSTNGLLGERVVEMTATMLRTLPPSCHLEVAVSLDGPPALNDEIRGVPGYFEKALTTYLALRHLAQENARLGTHLNYTISSYNAGRLGEFMAALREAGVLVVVGDISVSLAHQGLAFSNQTLSDLERGEIGLIRQDLARLSQGPLGWAGGLTGEARRVMKRVFFNLARDRYLKNPKKMVIPCAAAFASCFIDPYGTVYPCTIWGEPLGSLREVDFDLRRIWFSAKAEELRQAIKGGRCPICWSGCESSQSILQYMPLGLRFLI